MDTCETITRCTLDSPDLDALIAKHEPFILKCAVKASGRFISKSDEEWSCALEGFSKALQRFDPERGPFYPFAELVIRRTILDYFREKKEVIASGDWEGLKRDFMEKVAAANHTACALTENGLSFIAAQNLHKYTDLPEAEGMR